MINHHTVSFQIFHSVVSTEMNDGSCSCSSENTLVFWHSESTWNVENHFDCTNPQYFLFIGDCLGFFQEWLEFFWRPIIPNQQKYADLHYFVPICTLKFWKGHFNTRFPNYNRPTLDVSPDMTEIMEHLEI